MEYLADFTLIEPITNTRKHIQDFKIEASNKQQAIKQIKEWFLIEKKSLRIITS